MSSASGRINERERNGVPAARLARLTHAIWGIDHYPRYLERWRDEELGELEEELEATLRHVRDSRARSRAAYAVAASRGGEVAARLRDAAQWRACEVFEPRLLTALGARGDLPVADALRAATGGVGLGALLDEHEAAESAYALEVLRPEFCAALVAAIDAARDPEDGDARPFPAANLDALGFGWLADALLHVTERVARIAYPSETLGVTAEGHARAALDWRHAYALRYAPADATSATVTRDSLVPHTDDSEVTLNVGLTEAFQGGALCLGGTRGQADERAPLEDRLQPRVGLGLVHLGRRLHAVDRVTAGERRVLICWCRSLKGVRSTVCPCCWTNRRFNGTAGDCICGPAWNS